MKKRWLKIIATTGIVVAFLLLSAFTLALIYEDEVGELVLKELNKSLKQELTVEALELSFISSFPKAALSLQNVKVPDTRKGYLLEADKLSFQFGILSLFKDAIDIQSIIIQGGSLNIFYDKKGNPNYDIFKPIDTEETEESNLAFSIRKANLSQINLIYEDRRFSQSGIVEIDKLTLSGEFSTQQFDLKSYAEAKVAFIETKDGRLLSGRSIAYEATVKVDLELNEYQFENTRLYVETNTFVVNGIMQAQTDYTSFDLKLEGKDCSLQSVLSLIPKGQIPYLEDFDTRGNFYVKSSIEGRLSRYSMPKINFEFGLSKGFLSSEKLGNSISEVSFEVQYQNNEKSPNGKGFLEMTEFKGKLLEQSITSSFFIENFEDPYIDFRFEGKLPLKAGFGLLNSDLITDGDGLITFQSVIIEGKYADMIALERVPNVQAKGLVNFENVMLKVKDEAVKIPSGSFYLVDNQLEIKDFKLEGAGSDFNLMGDFNNILPILLRDSTNSKKAELKFDAILTSNKIDLNQIQKLLSFDVSEIEDESEVEALKTEENLRLERFTQLLKGRFRASFKDFQYDKINVKNFEGELAFNNNLMIIKGVEADAIDGKVSLTSKVHFEKSPYLESFIECKNIDGKLFFEQTNNFGQTIITAENLKGRLDAKMKLNAYWDENGNFLQEKLYVLADVTIKDGELNDFELLKNFSSFVKIEDLEKIKFTTVRNQLEVKNRKLFIPAMFIQNNAVNLTLAGTHDFDLNFDYKIKVNAGQVLSDKFKRFNPNRRPKKAKQNGWFNIYVNVFGNAETYDFSYSKKEVKEALEGDLANTFQQIQNDIQTEFSENPLEEPEEWTNEEGGENL